MILETKVHEEFHRNGQLCIRETRAIIAPLWMHLYNYRKEGEEGKIWCRIGFVEKYFDNGQIEWKLEYDNYGYITKNTFTSFRKDGTRKKY